MRGHNICFHGEIKKITFELSLTPPLVWSFAVVAKPLHRLVSLCCDNLQIGKTSYFPEFSTLLPPGHWLGLV